MALSTSADGLAVRSALKPTSYLVKVRVRVRVRVRARARASARARLRGQG